MTGCVRWGIALSLATVAGAAVSCGGGRRGPDAVPPGAIQDLTVVSATESGVTLTWTAPGDDGDKGRAAAYDLRYSLDPLPAGWDSATVVPGLAAPGLAGRADTAQVTDLVFGLTYFFALRTLDDAGNASGLSNVVEVETGDTEPPGQVTDLGVATIEPHAVSLRFTAPGDDGDQGTATAYELRYAAVPVTEATWEAAAPVPDLPTPHPAGTAETARATGLTPETTYHFALRARDNVGLLGPVSNDVVAALPADTVPPGAVADLQAVSDTAYQATLTWTAPGNDGSEGRAARYAVRYAGEAITAATWEAAVPVAVTLSPKEAGEKESVIVTGLPGRQMLWFSVRAEDEAGNEAPVSNPSEVYVRGKPRTWLVRVDGTGDAPTVQAGIDSAGTGDTVLVEPGRYLENIRFRGRDIVVRSEAGPETTILDGSAGDDTVVLFNSNESRKTVLEGLTITGAHGPHTLTRYSSGIYCAGASPTIRGNQIVGNTSADYAGALLVTGVEEDLSRPVSPLITGNLFEDNEAYFGGAITTGWGSSEIRGNVFRNNHSGSDGGAITIGQGNGPQIIEGNEFWDNESYDKGGAILVGNTNAGAYAVTVRSNLFVDNLSRGQHFGFGAGGGLFFSGPGEISGNTFVANKGLSGGNGACPGGGLTLYSPPTTLAVFGNIFFENPGCNLACSGNMDSGFALGVNLFWENMDPWHNVSLGSCWPSWSENQILADPLFCDPVNDDYHVAVNSPAITPDGVLGVYDTPGCGAKAKPAPSAWKPLGSRYPH